MPPAPPARPPFAVRWRAWWAETKPDLKWAVPLLFVAVLTLPILLAPLLPGGLWQPWTAKPVAEEDLAEVTDTIFSSGNYSEARRAELGRRAPPPGLVVPFEVLSVLLLAALVAGVVIAYRDPEEGDR